jgi:hypothetical protein
LLTWQAILDRKALPARATTTQSKSIILHNVQSLPGGIGEFLVLIIDSLPDCYGLFSFAAVVLCGCVWFFIKAEFMEAQSLLKADVLRAVLPHQVSAW